MRRRRFLAALPFFAPLTPRTGKSDGRGIQINRVKGRNRAFTWIVITGDQAQAFAHLHEALTHAQRYLVADLA